MKKTNEQIENEILFIKRFIEISLNIDAQIIDNYDFTEDNIANIMGNNILSSDLQNIFNTKLIIKSYINICKFTGFYPIKSALGVSYIFICISKERDKHLIIGPFMQENMQDESIYKLLAKLKLNNSHFEIFSNYFSIIPTIDNTQIESVCFAFIKHIFALKNIQYADVLNFFDLENTNIRLSENTENSLKSIIEKRYIIEEDLLKSVSDGDIQKSYIHYTKLTNFSNFQRFSNYLRDAKNKLLILNTLLRKATQQGGVHPIHLDNISSKWAKKIEDENSLEVLASIGSTMVRAYCIQVKNFSLKEYSPYVRKALEHIYINLYNDITVKGIADELGITSDYLSKMFKKELNQSIISYINNKRIQESIKLLNTTELSIQEISSSIGIPDLSYFGKLFKRQVGVSPKKYRENILKD